ncbi:MAG: glutamate-5-semialdehyde dehydrogenase, partial [Floccifex sp.]
DALQEGLEKTNLPKEMVQLIEDTTRQSAYELMNGVGYIDLLIPRGGKGLISSCVENAKVPCIETGTGICSVYVDNDCDIEMALKIVENAKTSRPSVCNAEETLLVHEDIASSFLPKLKEKIPQVQFRLDAQALSIIDGIPATEQDFDTEFLDYILAVKVVKNVEQAIEHIQNHSTHHSDCIVTNNTEHAQLFTTLVDSAAVYVNASTRFTDGGEFGLGCEMGISTQKLHARGPMGLKELTTYKYIIHGNGNIR